MVAVSALVVPVFEVEEVVGRFRRRLGPTARDGMPAHLTLLAPFVPPAEIDDLVVERLEAIIGSTAGFEFTFSDIGWFGRRVAYLEPVPRLPFIEMTELLTSAFPSCQPYGGEFAEVVPHLTIGEGRNLFGLRRTAERVRKSLPVSAHAKVAWLMATNEKSGQWNCLSELRFLDTVGAR